MHCGQAVTGYDSGMSIDHYENFPVASLLLPARLRAPVRHIYRFARTADDIADEGDASADVRLARLDEYRQALLRIRDGRAPVAPGHELAAIFLPLAGVIRAFGLSCDPFLDLLSAFSQDVGTSRYDTDAALLDYCRRSANPVGRLMLALYGKLDEDNGRDADAICTGLQLANFWQDVAVDWRKDRVYIPQSALRAHHLDDTHIHRRAQGLPVPPEEAAAWHAMMRERTAQTRALLVSGAPLAWRLPGRIGLELRLVVHGGLRILERLDQVGYDMFARRPTLGTADRLLLLWRGLSGRQSLHRFSPVRHS